MDPLRHSLHLLREIIFEHRQDLIKGDKKLTLDTSLVYRIKQLTEEDLESRSFTDREKAEIKSIINVLNNVQKLKISRRTITPVTSALNIEVFKSLKHLELINIPVDTLSGLSSIKSQLEVFVCSRCVNYSDVLSDEDIWHSLNVLMFKHDKIVDVGIDFFRNCPWLKHLDLSYNRLKNVNGLVALNNLRYLDLSFNCLECIPVLSKRGFENLQILLISHNYITSLMGIKHFVNLRGLDVSSNCLLDRFAIKELFNLSFLQWVTLSSNPLSFNPNHRLYAIYNIGTLISPQQFVLDNVALNVIEQNFLGRCNKSRYSCTGVPIHPSTSGEVQSGVRRQMPALKVSKVREVVIKEESDFEEVENVVNNIATDVEQGEHLESKKQVETLRQKYGKRWLFGDSGSYVQDLMGLTKNDVPSHNYDIPHYDILTKASLFRSQDTDNSNSGTSPKTTVESDPPVVPKKNEVPEESLEVGMTVATVHIAETAKMPEVTKSNAENTEDEPAENGSFDISGERPNDESSEEFFVSAMEDNEDDGNDSDEKDKDEPPGDEPWWVVQKVDSVNKKTENIFLILLDNELWEKDRFARKTTKWSLDTIQSCVKVKADPVTVELEFDSVRKDKQSRTYTMEYADAKALLKRVTTLLESRPLSAMNQSTYKCVKCASLFAHQQSQKSKQFGVVCPVCNSTFVVEMEEPRLPSNREVPEKSLSHSPSQSSIAFTSDSGYGTGSSGVLAQNQGSTAATCSAASLDQSVKSVKNIGASTPRRYESDIEIISNPSQSSIEVLEEHSRVGGSTPGRKRSSEERQAVVAVPQLGTVPEVQSPNNVLTESSSSGSMTESVITAYETHTTVNKIIIPEGTVLEEATEESPCNEENGTIEAGSQMNDSLEKSIDSVGDSNMVLSKEVYSYADYAQVDQRIGTFLREKVFESNEELTCLIRCHLWKSGGSDYQSCVVLSTESWHILREISSNYGEDASEWLSKEETFKLKDVKTVFTLIWYQGVGFQVKNIFYLLLLQDRKRTESLLKFFQGLSSKSFKLQKNPNSKIENKLCSALSSSIGNSPEDPTVTLYTICSSISVFKDEVCHDTMRLVGLLVTNGGLHIILGDLAWLTGSSTVTPEVHYSQLISCLIEVERSEAALNLHFLDETEGVEEVWHLSHATTDEVSSIIMAIQKPWENLFSVPLQVTTKQ